MKNLISYQKSGLNALRKAFSLIVVLCTSLQGVYAQEYSVKGWWNVSFPTETTGPNDVVSRVSPVDDCHLIYKVYVVKGTESSSNGNFGIYSGTFENPNYIKYVDVKNNISNYLSIESTEKGQCKFIISDLDKLASFYLDMSSSQIVLTESEPSYENMLKIAPSTGSSANLGSTLQFTSQFCSSQSTEDLLLHDWEISKDGDTWITAVSEDTSKTFDYTVLSDIKYVRCIGSYKDGSGNEKTVTSNTVELTVNKPTFNVKIEGDEGIRDINSVEKEVPSWRDVVIKMVDLPSNNVSNPKISYKELGSTGSYKPLTEATLSEDGLSWSLYSNIKSGWMRIETDVEVPASDGTSTTVTLKKEFIFRIVYSPDKNDAVQELFYDDFGYFDGKTYHYVKYKDGAVENADATEEVDASLPSNVKWMDDKNGFIKEHNFALKDTRTARLPLDSDGNPERNETNCWSKGSDIQPYQCWCENGFRVEDGYYAFVSNPSMADGGAKTNGGANDYWSGTDHTTLNSGGTNQGAMLMVNCAKEAVDAIIYERDFEITGECANVMVLFSAFVSNAQGIIPSGGATPVNIRMDIFEKDGTDVLVSIESGDVITRSYGSNSWSNLTALFPLTNKDNTEGAKKYTLKITNNAASGSGNDILLDDISLKVCFPEIEVKANVTGDEILDEHNIVICGKNRDLKLTAFNRAGIENYIPTPYYLFQYYDNTDSTWKNLPKESEIDAAISEDPTMDIKLSKKDFSGDTKFRVIVGNAEETIKKLIKDGSLSLNCTYTYAISEDFHVKFNPVGEDLDLFGCIGETINVDADANGRPSIEWIDYSGKALTTNDSITSIKDDKLTFVIPESILKAEKMSDTLYMIATTEGGLCSDTQIVSITKYDDLDFNIDNDTFYCEFDKNLKAVDVYPTSGINYVWKLKGSNLEDQTGSEFNVLKSTPELFDNTVTVTGTATGYCPITKSADFSIYRRYKLDLTVDVEGADKKVANVCLPTDGESSSRVDLKVEKVFADGSKPTYANEKVTTYFWYRKDGSNDSTLIGSGTETSFVDRLTENNIYTYSVTALDEVCYKNDGVATSDSTIINARKPLIVKLTEDKEEICKGDTITLNVKLTNALKVDTITSRLYENGSDLTSLLGTDKNYSYVPTNATKEKTTKDIKVKVMDMICSPSKPVADSVKFDVFVPLIVSLSSDADKGTQKCIRKENGDDYINVTLTVEQGNPRSIEWFDGEYPGLVFNRPVTVKQGENKISVKAYDEVCRSTGAAEFVEGADTAITITASEPIIISLTANTDSICNGNSVEMDMKVQNSLVNDPEVRWYERYNGIEDLKYTDKSIKTSKSHTPVNPTDFVVKKTMIVKTVDNICNAGKDVMDSVSYNIFIPIKLSLAHDADLNGEKIQKCITKPNVDNIVNLEVKVTAGNPSELIWSDGNYKGLVYKRQFVVSPGVNKIDVVGTDGVCPASATDKDDLDIVAATPIALSLDVKNPKVCDGSDVDFVLKVENTLDPEKVEVRWYDEGTKVYTTNGASLVKSHTSSNSTTAYVTKTMTIKADDEICSKGTEISTSANYTVYKPVKFNLTSDASEFNVANTKCLGQTSHGDQTSAEVRVNLTQGNPTKFVWSDGVEWEWVWINAASNKNSTSWRDFELKRGTNTLSVIAYDEVCNKEGATAEFEGEDQEIKIEARTPISVSLDLDYGRHIMCKGEDISLKATVYNENEGINTKLEWSENHGVKDGIVENGSYTTNIFTPEQGDLVYTIKASENVATPICPSQTASEYVSVQVNTKLKIYTSEDAICQDTSGRDSVKLIKLTARVRSGRPQAIIWSTGDTTKIDTGYSYLMVAPMEDQIYYSAYGYDSVCVKTTTAYSDTISVDHRNYVTLSAEDYKVQMGEEVELKADYLLPAGRATRYYEMISPKKRELERNHEDELNWELDEPGHYQFRVKLDNGNCGIRKSNIIDIDVADYVIVPNVITPYNDNPKNDKFMEGYDVKIFNRYQETVYEGTDGWDATYRGALAAPGTYFYILTKKDGRVLKGTIEVYRK